MKYSERCVEMCKRFEGYHRKLPNGDCTAYQERINGKLDVPTIGYGSTHGVEMGMVWTEAQAEAALREELDHCNAFILRIVTIDINENELGALNLFTYNLGPGALQKSTLLKKLNEGNRAAAAKEFARWGNFKGKPVKGLQARRAAEAALFLEPIGNVAPDYMPQDAHPSGQAPSPQTVVTATALSLGVAKAATDPAPAHTFTSLMGCDSANACSGLVMTLAGLPMQFVVGLGILLLGIWGVPIALKWIRGQP